MTRLRDYSGFVTYPRRLARLGAASLTLWVVCGVRGQAVYMPLKQTTISSTLLELF